MIVSDARFSRFENNFMGVPVLGTYPSQAFDDRGSENAWNASWPTGGNYWVDYTGEDKMSGPDQNQPGPGDGIVDLPFQIDVNTWDRYPLTLTQPVEPIPEFPTLLLPIVSVLALLFAVVRRSSRKEF